LHVLVLATLIGIAGNLDNLGVGVAYGVRRIGIPFRSNLFIAVVAAVGTVLTAYAGMGISRVLQPAFANVIGAGVIIAVGVWVLWPRRPAKPEADRQDAIGLVHHPEQADADLSGDISLAESIALSVGLGINAWAGGLGGGLVGLSPWLLALSTGLFSFVTLWAGEHLGRRALGGWLGPKATIAAGVLLILIGLKDLV
jgi:putative sporulation protein YtaF